jgi:hypothetical protein
VADSLSQTRVQDLDDVGCGQNGNYYIPLYTMPMDITKSIPIDDGNELARAHLVSPTRTRTHAPHAHRMHAPHAHSTEPLMPLCVCCRLFVTTEGVLFVTYSMLVSKTTRKKKTYSRFNQIVKWCGADFEGCIGTSRPFTILDTRHNLHARARARGARTS